MPLKRFGKLPAGKELDRLKQSPQHDGKSFRNFSDTPMMAPDASYFKMLREFFSRKKNAAPASKFSFDRYDLDSLKDEQLVWFGHSSYLMKLKGKHFLIDPVFSGHASPFSFMVKAFRGSDLYKPGDLPSIDHLVITHDHYDHLDYNTIKALKHKINHIVCPPGVASHFRYWGFDDSMINELDWWDSLVLDTNITITATPARHFSGRGLKRNQSLWNSYVLNTGEKNFYLGGDSGYDIHFKLIGEKFKRFELAVLETGQYNKMWPLIHMMPEEAVRAASDLGAKAILPVHWGKFSLAMHEWNEPVIRLLNEAEGTQLKILTPKIGEIVKMEEHADFSRWFENV